MSGLRLCRMTQPGEEAARARSLGLALLAASRIYEGFVLRDPELRGPPAAITFDRPPASKQRAI